MSSSLKLLRKKTRASVKRSSRPSIEGLEDRMLLYATEGALWQYSSRITYSFVPDGTNIGGLSSNLFATLNSVASTSTWEAQVQKAAAIWESTTNVNLAQVSDNGEPLGANGNQQDDPNVGDIRISMAPMGTDGALAVTFIPPPVNGGTEAGDIVFNSSYPWGINNGGYDIETVAVHEFGHALGLGDQTTDTSAVMYGYYNGINTNPDADDQAGIRSLYGAYPAPTGTNKTEAKATNITSMIVNNQIAISGLYLGASTDCDWFTVTVPSTTNGTATFSMQSTNLSSLSPRMNVEKGTGLVSLGQSMLTGQYGATATVTVNGVTPGQVISFRAGAAPTQAGYDGSFGILVNFGSGTQAPIAPPNTVVPWAPGTGGGNSGGYALIPRNPGGGGSSSGVGVNLQPVEGTLGLVRIHVGSLSFLGETLQTKPLQIGPIDIGLGTSAPITVSSTVAPLTSANGTSPTGAGSTTPLLGGAAPTVTATVSTGAVSRSTPVGQTLVTVRTALPPGSPVTPVKFTHHKWAAKPKAAVATHSSVRDKSRALDAALTTRNGDGHSLVVGKASTSTMHTHHSRH